MGLAIEEERGKWNVLNDNTAVLYNGMSPAYRYRRIPLPIVIPLFYLAYGLFAVLGNIVINYVGVTLAAWLLIVTYVCGISLGAFVGYLLGVPRVHFGRLITSRTFQVWGIIAVAIVTAISWRMLIQQYGSLGYIFANAYKIRISTIGIESGSGSVLYGYIMGLVYGVLAVSLARLGHYGKRRDIAFAAGALLLVALIDLRTFGRLGIVFSIFCIGGFVCIYRIRIFTLRNILIAIMLFLIMSAPRLIRGSFDNFSSTVSSISWAMNFQLPPALNSLVSVYVYYFSSPYALSEYLSDGGLSESLTYGFRTFTPIFRLINRFAGLEYINTIDEFASVPFSYNIYTVIRDFYQDFGILGASAVPLLLGLFLGVCFRWRGIFYDAFKILLLGWVFYSPLYNIFSFGAPMIGITAVFLGCLFWKPDKPLLRRKHKMQTKLRESHGQPVAT